MKSSLAEGLPILVIDDDHQMLRTISDILRLKGYEPLAAPSAAQGLEIAEHMLGGLAVALVDLRLPDMDGIEVVSRLRSLSDLTEVLILTGNASVDSAVRAMREQSYDYLIKPVHPAQLLSSIGRAGDRWQRRRVEVAMRESEERLQRIFDHVADALFITDDGDSIADANPTACELTGLPLEHLRGRRITDVLPGETSALHARGDGRQPPLPPGEHRFRDPSGAVHIVDIRVTDVLGGLRVHSVRDLTAQRRLEEELNHAQKMEAVGRLAGGVAHDFNNLLTVITCFSDMHLATLDPLDGRRGDVQEISKAARRAAALTGQLLAFSRKQILQPKIIDLNAIVADVEKMLRRVIGEDIELVSACLNELWLARADPGQIEQVLMNLAVNARDAMPNGGTLHIETSNVSVLEPRRHAHGLIQPGDYVALRVADAGHGMSEDTLKHLFEPFFTTKGPGRGTGLGLSTVYGVVEQSGGYVEVTSALGQGTAFTLYLPREEAEPLPAHSSETRASADRRDATILVVEDDPIVRDLVRGILARRGYTVLAAKQGEEAIALAERYAEPLHLLITDVVLPGLNGREIAERLQSSRPDLRVLFMSGYTDDTIIRRGVIEHQHRLLQKPFTAEELEQKVAKMLAE
jgi:PAS domain S-box-containing protein